MTVSLDFQTLRRAYASGQATPVAVVREVISRVERRGDDGVWISRVPTELLLEEARAVERRAAAEGIAALQRGETSVRALQSLHARSTAVR